jgi:hypothetical protein
MKRLSRALVHSLFCFTMGIGTASADNQTADTTPISMSGLPFKVVIQQAPFQLPVGIQGGVVGIYHGQWILIGGRTNGVHGFSNTDANFPPASQNSTIYVVNPATGQTASRSLFDPGSGLNQQQIDTLSVTSPQAYQEGDTLYVTGGYGFSYSTGTYTTQAVLTAINLQGLVQWVNGSGTVVNNISQLYNAEFQITGGRMYKLGSVTQLVFGQDFEGSYNVNSNGNYSEQVRRFQISSNGGQVAATILPSLPSTPDANFRRRDLNVVPAIFNVNNLLQYGLIAYGGVFTPTVGVWNVPVIIKDGVNPAMADPNSPASFKQGMNQYSCATAGLFSKKTSSMYNIFFGGISFGFYVNGTFQTDNEIPFTNEITTVKMDKNGNFTQYLMDGQYPNILSPAVNPNNNLLFGGSAYFIPNNISSYPNNVINLDNIRAATVIGYIVGGIASTLPNTNTIFDSYGSPYVFTVTLVPTG